MAADPSLTPEQIQAQSFTSGFRGYDQSEVRDFLGRRGHRGPVATRSHPTPRIRLAFGRGARRPPACARRGNADRRRRRGDGEHPAGRPGGGQRPAVPGAEDAERIVADAQARAAELRSEAEGVLGRETKAAEEAAARIVEKARAEAAEMVDKARIEADALRAAAQHERNLTIEGAISTRERILEDLSRRRRVASVQIEQLRAGRERLLESYAVVRRTLEEVNDELNRADAEARAAADEVGRRMREQLPERPLHRDPGRGRAGDRRARRAEGPATRARPRPGNGPGRAGGPGQHGPATGESARRRARARRGRRRTRAAPEPPRATTGPGPRPEPPRLPPPRPPRPRRGAVDRPGRSGRQRGPGRRHRLPGRNRPTGRGGGRAAIAGGHRRRGLSGRRRPRRRAVRPAAGGPRRQGGASRRGAAAAPAVAHAHPGRRHRRGAVTRTGRDEGEAPAHPDDGLLRAAAGRAGRPRVGAHPPAEAGPAGRAKRSARPPAQPARRTDRRLPAPRLADQIDHYADIAHPSSRRRPPPASPSPSRSSRAGRRPAPAAPTSTIWPTMPPPPSSNRCDAASSTPSRCRPATSSRCSSRRSAPPTGSGRASGSSALPAMCWRPPSPGEPGTRCPTGGPLRWVVQDTGGPCPDCDDDVLAGSLPKGEPFPTGQPYPPAHPGCRCLLVPVAE